MSTHAPHRPRHKTGRIEVAEVRPHPLAVREVRTAFNYRMKAQGIPAKACSKCLRVLPLVAFEKFRSASDGLRSYCRACKASDHARRMAGDAEYVATRRAAALAYNATHDEQRRSYRGVAYKERRQVNLGKNVHRVPNPQVMKRCAGQCGEVLPETSFRLDRGSRDGLRDRCKYCSDATRRARRVCLATYGPAEGQLCYLCGGTIRGDASVDHVVPQSQGGPDIAENVRWTHSSCNFRRHTKPLTAEQTSRLAATRPLGGIA